MVQLEIHKGLCIISLLHKLTVKGKPFQWTPLNVSIHVLQHGYCMTNFHYFPSKADQQMTSCSAPTSLHSLLPSPP